MSDRAISVEDLVYAIMEFHHIEALKLEKPALAMFPGPYMVIWHSFFYHLKRGYSDKFPELSIDFDWDGPFPRSPRVQESLDSMFPRLCTTVLHENRMILWIKKPSNPLKEINPELHDLVVREADIYENFLDYHPLPL